MTPTPNPAPTRRQRLSVWWRYWFVDHAWVRSLVSNHYELDADVWRSNQPGFRRLARLKRKGLRSVLSLRGDGHGAAMTVEKEAAHAAGLQLEFISLSALTLPPPELLLDAIDKLRTMPKPLLVHCKSGADRTGLLVTIYLHAIKGMPLKEARKSLSWRYAHASWGRAGIVHEVLDAYAADREETGIDFEEWVRTRYDPVALTQKFEERRKGR